MDRGGASGATPAPGGSVAGKIERGGRVEALPGMRDGSTWAPTTSEEMFRIAARLVLSMRPNEQLIACTGIAADDPSAQVALNIGLALARLGHGPVLVIDANLRAPSMHETIGATRSPGLAEQLQGSGGRVPAVRVGDVPNLGILTAGEGVQLTPATLSSAGFRDCFEGFRTWHYVVMDIGPVLLSAESLMMASAVDVVVASLAAGQRNRKDLLRLKEEIGLLSARFLGVILTDTA